ncbi:MAG: formate/nitrite transporter family protein [Clostridia bacterium]|nr:formate/nitrite transporter family protein [Clostridia bacterium]
MNHALAVLIESILAGIALAVGCTAYVTVGDPVVGGFLFSIALFTIVTNRMSLFSGKVCLLLDEGGPKLSDLPVIWFGNLAGVAAIAYALRQTRLAPAIIPNAARSAQARSGDSSFSVLVLAICCNFLICMAVRNYRDVKDVGKYIGVILSVAVFVTCGFQHCIADMYYYCLANHWNADVLRALLITTGGNIIGGLLIPFGQRCTAALREQAPQKTEAQAPVSELLEESVVD